MQRSLPSRVPVRPVPSDLTLALASFSIYGLCLIWPVRLSVVFMVDRIVGGQIANGAAGAAEGRLAERRQHHDSFDANTFEEGAGTACGSEGGSCVCRRAWRLSPGVAFVAGRGVWAGRA